MLETPAGTGIAKNCPPSACLPGIHTRSSILTISPSTKPFPTRSQGGLPSQVSVTFSCLHVVSVSGSNLSPAAVLEPSPKLLESGARLYPLPPVLWLEAELAARSEVLPRPGDELQASPSCLIGTEATPCCPEAPAGNTPGMDGAL